MMSRFIIGIMLQFDEKNERVAKLKSSTTPIFNSQIFIIMRDISVNKIYIKITFCFTSETMGLIFVETKLKLDSNKSRNMEKSINSMISKEM